MLENKIERKIMIGHPGGQQKRDRPKLRWLIGIEADLRKLGIRNWIVLAQDLDQWQHVVEEAKLIGL